MVYYLLYPLAEEAHLDRLLRLVEHGPVLVTGGRGVGKTKLMHRARHALTGAKSWGTPKQGEDTGIVWLDRHMPEVAVHRAILNWLEEPRGTLLVDHLQRCYDLELDRAIVRAMEGGARYLPMLATSREPGADLEARVSAQAREAGFPRSIHELADAVTRMQRYRVDAWPPLWRERLRSSYRSAVQRTRDLLAEHREGAADLFSDAGLIGDAFLDGWVDLVEEVTGGHPVLVDGSYNLLLSSAFDHLVKQSVFPATDDLVLSVHRRANWMGEVDLESLVAECSRRSPAGRMLLETFLRSRQLRLLRLTLVDMREALPDLFFTHVGLASGDGSLELNGEKQEQLLGIGLVARDPTTAELYVPPGMVRDLILALAAENGTPAEVGGHHQQDLAPVDDREELRASRSPGPVPRGGMPFVAPERWEGLRICLVDGRTVRFSVPGQRSVSISASQLGLTKGNTRDQELALSWKLLVALCEGRGQCDWRVLGHTSFDSFKQHSTKLRAALRAAVGLEGDPLPVCNRWEGVKTRFIAMPEEDSPLLRDGGFSTQRW